MNETLVTTDEAKSSSKYDLLISTNNTVTYEEMNSTKKIQETTFSVLDTTTQPSTDDILISTTKLLTFEEINSTNDIQKTTFPNTTNQTITQIFTNTFENESTPTEDSIKTTEVTILLVTTFAETEPKTETIEAETSITPKITSYLEEILTSKSFDTKEKFQSKQK